MKVAIVLNTSWNIYNFRMGLIKALQQQGHQIITIAPEDDYTAKLTEANCEYIPLRMDSRGANPIKDFGLTLELIGIYKRIKPDVVLHYTIEPNINGTLAAAITRTPAINNVCGLGTVFLKNNLVSLVAKGLYKLAFAFPNKVFFQNQDDLNLFAENKLIDESITDILPGSGIDLSKFHPLKKARDKKFSFLMISRLIHDKGVLEYIEAIKILRGRGIDAEFKLLGPKDPLHARGIQLDIIDGWIESNSVDYLGKTDDVKPFLAEADCVVLPSYREGTPRSLLEAASVCKPIVATDVPGCREVVVHGHNGLLCNLKDANDLADKMMEMAAYDAERIHQMGENGRQRVLENFDESIVIDKYIGAINEILK